MTDDQIAAVIRDRLIESLRRIETAIDYPFTAAWKTEMAQLDEFEALIGLITGPDPKPKLQ